jgi:hypothetical protein
VNWLKASQKEILAAAAVCLTSDHHVFFRARLVVEAARASLTLQDADPLPAVAAFRCHAELVELLGLRVCDQLDGKNPDMSVSRFLSELNSIAERGGCRRDLRIAFRKAARWLRLCARTHDRPCPSGTPAFLRSDQSLWFLIQAITELTWVTRTYIAELRTYEDRELACYEYLSELANHTNSAVDLAVGVLSAASEDKWNPHPFEAEAARIISRRIGCPGGWVLPFARTLEVFSPS